MWSKIFVSRDFSEYAWSLRTPDRRLDYSGIKYTDQTFQVDEVEEALKKELEGPGKLIGYRALHKKLRQVHELSVPRDLVYDVMYNVDPDALAERAPQVKKATFTDLNIQQHHLSLWPFIWEVCQTLPSWSRNQHLRSHICSHCCWYICGMSPL